MFEFFFFLSEMRVQTFFSPPQKKKKTNYSEPAYSHKVVIVFLLFLLFVLLGIKNVFVLLHKVLRVALLGRSTGHCKTK